MTGAAILYALFGAVLVAFGVLAAALADRIRGIRPQRELRAPARGRAREDVMEAVVVEAVPTIVEDLPSRPLVNATATQKGMATEVIAALVASGFRKSAASEAAWCCTATERRSIEDWTVAALRRCAKGAVS